MRLDVAGSLVVVLGCTALCAASPVVAGDLSVSLGIKSWYSAYSSKKTDPWPEAFGGGKNVTRTKDKNPGMMVGPNVKFAYGQGFGGFSYLSSIKEMVHTNYGGMYSYSETENKMVKISEDISDTSLSREDMDFIVGYMPIKWLGCYLGYKIVSTEVKGSDSTQRAGISIKGPGIGIVGAYQIPSTRMALSANIAYLWLRREYDSSGVNSQSGDDIRSDYPGFSSEISLSYTFAEHVGLSLGYKYQQFTYHAVRYNYGYIWSEWDSKDTFSGITAGVDYRF